MKATSQSISPVSKNQVSLYFPIILFSLCCLVLFPDIAHAGTGGTELNSAATKIKELATGSVAKAIGFGGIIASGIAAVATQKWVPFLGLGGALLGMMLAPGIVDTMFTALI